MESEFAELSNKCIDLENKNKELQELWEKREDGVSLISALNETLKISLHQTQQTRLMNNLYSPRSNPSHGFLDDMLFQRVKFVN